MNKLIFIIYILYAIAWFTGCVVVKQADIKDSTFNTSGWKSNAGDGGDKRVDAVTSPTTDASLTGL